MNSNKEQLVHRMNVTPEQAWEVIGSVGGVDRWFSSMISTCRVDGDRRYCETSDGIRLEEHILEVNHETHTFRFGIPVQDLLPVQNIVETMQVRSDGKGKALVEWSAIFDATEENAAIAAEAFQQLWLAGLNEMETFILQNQVLETTHRNNPTALKRAIVKLEVHETRIN